MIDYERLVKWFGDRNIKTILYASVDLQEALQNYNRKGIVTSLSIIESIVTRYSELYDVTETIKQNANEINEFDYRELCDRYSPSRERMREARLDNE